MTATRSQKLSEPAWDALSEALTVFHWFKEPFETLVRARFADPPELLSRLTFGETKRSVVTQLVRGLRANEQRYQPLVIDALLALAQFDPAFPHLVRLEDGDRKVATARAALRQVQQVTEQYSSLAAERRQLREELASQDAAAATRRSHESVLRGLHDRFVSMFGADDPQQRGRDFEVLLNELFELSDLYPRAAYSLEHEQIDGAFTCRTDDYLLEARWWKDRLEPKHLNDFKVKVDGKARNTLGLCIAVNGFSAGAVAQHSNSGTPLVLMDGTDLMPILEGRIELLEVLERKRRHAAETGQTLYRALP